MGEATGISWAQHTWSPWIGCTKVSPACDGCYAAHLMDTRMGRVEWGPHGERKRTSPSYWGQLRRWDRKAKEGGTRPFTFPSLCDPFDNGVPPEWRREWFDEIRSTSHLVHLLLTKRIGNALRMIEEAGGLPLNAAIGATMANQEEYDRDRMKLWRVKEEINPLFTFGSFEPLLGRVVLDKFAPDWIITGGETNQGGHRARTTEDDWFRYLCQQSAALGRAFHLKQITRDGRPLPMSRWPLDLRVQEFPHLRPTPGESHDG